MKLLIVTQVIDTGHPVLGFFHRWVEEFAKHFEHVHVICLEVGKHSLPTNVTVHSLGKEEDGKGKFTYIIRFYSLIWKLRHEYDRVFIHMNQEYVLLAGGLWRIWKKPITMWRNHYSGGFLTKMAGWFCQSVFYTSKSSYTARFKNSNQMPIGIDPDIFYSDKQIERKSDSLLYVGRLSKSKRVHLILEALDMVIKERPEYSLTIVGGPSNPEETNYQEELRKTVEEKSLPVNFLGSVAWEKLPIIYNSHELCINLSPPGMFDKVIGEALLCECDVITTNLDLSDALEQNAISDDILVQLKKRLLNYHYDVNLVKKRKYVILGNHSLSSLVLQVLNK